MTTKNTQGEENVIRQNIPAPEPGSSLGHLPSGYADGGGATSEQFFIPPCGIEDCDKAIHALFNQTIKFSTQTYGGGQTPVYIKKPHVIFATGEKFAIAKKLRPPRDKNQVLMLPAISIRRTSLEQTPEDITGRGMNQFTGDIVIKRRLAPEDQNYQNLINKFAFENLSSTPTSTDIGKIGKKHYDLDVQNGAILDPKLGQNIFEIFTVPQPQFFTAIYDVIFWTGYHEHMNYMIETFMSSFLPQGKMFRLGTPKKYWFMAYVEDTFASQDNFDDFSNKERIIRYNFSMKVKGFLLAPNGPANMVPVRRYLSAPNISFEISSTPTGDILTDRDLAIPPLGTETDNRFILSDINTAANSTPKEATEQKFLFKKTFIDPISGKKVIKYIKKTSRNQKKGETTYSASDIATMQEFLLNND